MPDYGFNYNLGPQARQTNLADMLNFANSAQQFQQAQQINPLLLRQQQLATQKAEALTPEEIQTGTTRLQEERKREPIATKEKDFEYKKKQGALATQIITGFLRDPNIINMTQNPEGSQRMFDLLEKTMINQGVDPQAVKEHLTPLVGVAKEHPEQFPNILKYLGTAATTSEAQQTRRTPQLTVGPNNAPVLFTPESGTIAPANISQGQQSKQTYETETTELPKVGGVSLAYPVRKAGSPAPLDPSETSDKEAQIAHRIDLTKRQRSLTAAEDTSEKIFKTLDKLESENFFKGGGVAARAERLINKFINNEENQRLAKLLANETIANAKTLGVADSSGNVSVAGLNMQAVASGNTENVTPDVLREVARFNQANRMNIDLQAKAKEAFSKQYGDANGRTFDQVWRNNSNNTLFEALAIDKSKMPYKEKQAAYKKLFEGLSSEDLADFKNKKSNIDAMVNGNFAGVK